MARGTRAAVQKPRISARVRATGPGYQVNARSALAPQSTSRDSSGSVSRNVAAFAPETAANPESWQAQLNHLGHVVGILDHKEVNFPKPAKR